MNIVKLDTYDYDIKDVPNDKGGYSHSIINVYLDSEADPYLYDIANQLEQGAVLYADRTYFNYLKAEMSSNYSFEKATRLSLWAIKTDISYREVN